MRSNASTVAQYLAEAPVEQAPYISKLRKIIRKYIPKGFREEINYGMIGYVVPHKIYPA